MDVGPQTEQAPLSVDLIDPAPDSVLTASPPRSSSNSIARSFPIRWKPMSWSSGSTPTATRRGTWPPMTSPSTPRRHDSPSSLPETLKPGHYQVWILGRSSIMDVDGNYLTDGLNDLVVGQFDVAVPGVTLDDAVDLGKPGPTPMEVPGTLDFQAASRGVSLYRIHLDPGHFWRLGLEVTAERDGGTLDTALALFDDQGRPIATDEVGRKDFPNDPYLFAGLDPGTYYVGVSGVNNLPGPGGGYDPATGSAGVGDADPGRGCLHAPRRGRPRG